MKGMGLGIKARKKADAVDGRPLSPPKRFSKIYGSLKI